jgi:hypothetical protein
MTRGLQEQIVMPDVIFIKTTREIEMLWIWLSYLSSEDNVSDRLLGRIEADMDGFDYRTLMSRKLEAIKRNEENSLFSTITNDVVREHAPKIAKYVLQAKELFQAARKVSEISSPILYYYGMQSLGNALIYSTYIFRPSSQKEERRFHTHGLGINRNTYDGLAVSPFGFFSRFHDCYSTEPEVYLKKFRFSLKELLSVNPELVHEYLLVYGENPNMKDMSARAISRIDVDLEKYETMPVNGINLNIIDCIFMTMFILSNKARYRPEVWIEEISSRPESFILRSFLIKAQRRFPNLILNKIWGITHLFAPVGRAG